LLIDEIELSYNRNLDFSRIKSVWFYRWGHLADSGNLSLHKVISSSYESLNKHLKANRDILSGYLFDKLYDAKWLGHPQTSSLNKLTVLRFASNEGLIIPETILATTKKDIENFKQKHKNIITKALSELVQLEYKNKIYASYTSEIKELNYLSDTDIITPTLIQNKIEKSFEIRTFYLNGKFFSMAIFSQSIARTSLDFRLYSNERPNRNVPFKLPKNIEIKLEKLCNRLNLNTCSIDLIYNKDKQFIFLEINPVGQFGMTSKPCNYKLDKLIAESL
jgi:ATP-GRASP peptide maturase of grasp-with-spasm system